MLRASEEQQEHITEIINKSFEHGKEEPSGYANDTDITLWIPYDDGYDKVCVDIPFDMMAAIVDYLRTSDKKDDLFESCWIAYRRKGIKRKSKEYWNKLSEKEKGRVLPHIKAYVGSRELQYQKDFERYLRDKVFLTIVFKDNKVIYDPTKVSGALDGLYMPTTDGALSWNDYYNCYIYTGWWDGVHISDGYDDFNRPDKATVMLNNGRGTLVWDNMSHKWVKI